MMNDVLKQIKFANDFWVVMLPAILMALDIVTGFVNAWSKNDIKSSVMRQGLARKFGELVVIAIGQLFFYGVGLPKYIVAGISTYIILMELISICENLKKLGVPIPKFISRALASAEKQIDEIGDEEKEAPDNDPEGGEADDESMDA
ncbi:MAG: phage holin family protein [Bacteroidales bacterium]|nr:phage holin family protein [Bacteroidales bacterium]